MTQAPHRARTGRACCRPFLPLYQFLQVRYLDIDSVGKVLYPAIVVRVDIGAVVVQVGAAIVGDDETRGAAWDIGADELTALPGSDRRVMVLRSFQSKPTSINRSTATMARKFR